MRIPFFVKILAGGVLTVLGLTAVTLLAAFTLIRSHYTDTLATDLRHTASLLAVEVGPLLEGDPSLLQERVSAWGPLLRARITVVDAEGRVLADSEADPGTMENHRNRPEFHRVFAGGEGRDVRLSHTVHREMLYVAVPVATGDRTTGAVRLSLFLDDVKRLLGSLRHRLLTGALAAAALASIGAYLLARHLSRPIALLSAAAQELSEGRFGARVFLRRRDELAGLAERFNAMAERLQALFAESARKTEEVNRILNSLRDGLMVLDREGRVLLENPRSRELAGGRSLRGLLFWEAFREPAFIAVVKRTLDGGGPAHGEVALGGRVHWGGTTPLETGGCIVLLSDITEIRRLEAVKRDFVVSASHELRTPLTAIRGYAETLEEEVGPDQRRHVEIIRRHADRLARLTEDLLSLAELEETGSRLHKEPVDLRALAERVLELFAPAAKVKGLDLRVEGVDLPSVPADPFRLEQVLINLIDNAVKHTEHGSVTVVASRVGDSLRLSVADTGSGIPAEHLPRLFERFYVVDRSRSRTLGGTGLGLAIVKHIVQLHGGTVTAESTPGRGSIFTVILPLS